MTAVAKPDVLVCTSPVGSLTPGYQYHFLCSPSWSKCAYLVQYVHGPRPARKHQRKMTKRRNLEPTVVVHFVKKQTFEDALDNEILKIHRKCPSLPPWMLDQNEGDLIALSDRRRSTVEPHHDRIDRRIAVIHEASSRIEEILCLDNPLAEINKIARQQKPVQNVTRFRCWVFTYLLFGSAGLHYSTASIGRWCRKSAAETKTLTSHSAVTQDKAKKILDAYHKHKSERSTQAIYATAMRVSFGCLSQTNELGRRSLYHPKGEWFPTERVFFYHVDQQLNRNERKVNRLGPKRFRTHDAPSQGSFTQFVGNAYERVEYDPFHGFANPVGLSGKTMPKLITARLRDAASGIITGISFDMGGETLEAYRAAQFCSAIDKQIFCRFFGVIIGPYQWPCVGVSLKVHMDRGAAAEALGQRAVLKDDNPELAPSGQGQSKAISESSHPRNLNDEEGPNYVQSKLSVFQMCKQEIIRVLKDNESFDVVERIPAEWIGSIDRGTPVCLYNEFVRRGRCDAVTMSFDTAVRKYLPLTPVTATRDGITLAGHPFVSRALQETDFFLNIPKGRTIELEVYYLRACVHFIWLEYQGIIFELEICFKINNGKEASYLTLDELESVASKKRTMANELKAHARGVRLESDEMAVRLTGVPLDASVRRAGRAKKNRQSEQESIMNIAAVRGRL